MTVSDEKIDPVLFRYRFRELRASDLDLVLQTIQEYYARGRSHISRVLCEVWGWRQPSGALKEYPCRDLLLRLEEAGYIQLPPRKRTKANYRKFDRVPQFSRDPLDGPLSKYRRFEVRPLASARERYLWDYWIEQFHYLGYRPIVGEHLKYLAFLDGREVACIGWGGAAWKSRHRETFVGWTESAKKDRLHLVVNNVRFLILPWVRIPHLASKALAAVTRRLSPDWQAKYGHPVYLAETFVDALRFRGTCYRAANWTYVGDTEGSAKRGSRYYDHGHPKAMFLLPIHRRFRELLQHGSR